MDRPNGWGPKKWWKLFLPFLLCTIRGPRSILRSGCVLTSPVVLQYFELPTFQGIWIRGVEGASCAVDHCLPFSRSTVHEQSIINSYLNQLSLLQGWSIYVCPACKDFSFPKMFSSSLNVFPSPDIFLPSIDRKLVSLSKYFLVNLSFFKEFLFFLNRSKVGVRTVKSMRSLPYLN